MEAEKVFPLTIVTDNRWKKESRNEVLREGVVKEPL